MNVFWDSGSQLSLITNKVPNKLKLRGKKVRLAITVVANQIMEMDAFEYKIQLLDTHNRSVEIKAISIDNISSPIGRINRREVCKISGNVDAELMRPIDGEIGCIYINRSGICSLSP